MRWYLKVMRRKNCLSKTSTDKPRQCRLKSITFEESLKQ